MTHAVKVTDSDVEKRREAIRLVRGSLVGLAPGVSLADELIADRRGEARRESREPEEKTRRGGG